MENASKALIIAGAILISILLISVGVLIMTSTSGVTDSVGDKAEAMEIESFNAQFLNFEGVQSASQVSALKSKINASNASSADHKITGTAVSVTITNGKKYTVTLVYGTNGYITSINATVI